MGIKSQQTYRRVDSVSTPWPQRYSADYSDDGEDTNSVSRRLLMSDKDTESTKKQETVRWRDLPEKGQLAVLTLARLSEPLVQTSLQSYMFYQLQGFRPDLPASAIARQAGLLHASFTAAQCLTAMLWGRLADSPRFGRKTVLMIGLGGAVISCLGFGFSQSFAQALVFRSLGGATNGNVGVLRTIETVRDKKYQSRAFLIMPLTFNMGVIVGPILGGVLCDPARSYPALFGGSRFLQRYPYATPNFVSAAVLLAALLAVWLGLEETLDAKRDQHDAGLALGRRMVAMVRGSNRTVGYAPLATHSRNASTATIEAPPPHKKSIHPRYTQRLPFRRLLTRNVLLTLLAQAIFAFHMGTFNALWFVFLSTPVAGGSASGPFFFTGGIGLQPRDVGLAMAILGCFGVAMQLLLYPSVSARLGLVRSWRVFLCCFPLSYFAMPYLSLIVPSTSAAPHPKDGVLLWLAMAAVLLCHVTGRTFVLPAQTILVNNCTPHPSVLGTLHGLALSTSALARTLGPVGVCGYVYGWGLEHGMVGAAFWALSGVAVLGVVSSLFVREGNGHEIWLEGDVEEE